MTRYLSQRFHIVKKYVIGGLMIGTKTNGKSYYVQWKIIDPLTNKTHTKRKTFKLRRDAVKFEAELKVDKVTPSTSKTFDEMLEFSLDYTDATPNTRRMKRNTIHAYFPFCDMKFEKITRENLLAWRSDFANSGLATRTRNRIITYVKSVFNFAETIYSLPNPSKILKSYAKTQEEKQKEMEVWTVEEFNQFLSCIEHPYYHAYFNFLFWTGCRRSEALAICKEDINGNEVSINKSIKHFQNGFLPLKNEASKRTIRIDKQLLEELKPLIERANPFVFGGETSLGIASVQREFTQGIKKSGVKKIRIHDLRHSHATLLINQGVNIVAVSKRLGHSNITTTMDVYTHLLKHTDDALMDKIEEVKSHPKVTHFSGK